MDDFKLEINIKDVNLDLKKPSKKGRIKENLKGLRFGRLLVINTSEKRRGRTYWLCKCDCGKEKTVSAQCLKRGTQSCGCKQRESVRFYHRRKTLIGTVFGRLIVKNEFFKDHQRWCVCECSCGRSKEISAEHLISKITISCGCAWDEFLKNKIKYKSVDDRHAVFRPMINNAAGTAKGKNLEFDLDLEYLFDIWESQNGICPYTGIIMEIPQWNQSRKERHTVASIDRIDSSKGYLKGNIQFVSVIANYAKNTFSHEEMINFCKSVALFWKDRI